ncbi:Nicotinate-nucleotide-dimethylbenzimidazole phosphoribosyltransferase [Methanococcus aeolicus Nankai-3]|uniref:UPF0284 protein Maeo_0615 n=1 Tax=Methanococcus aeolicus (strain ATCC BAA-1280 / DSM 17508 / OCM 812 / Nankai-3) TaxID=419665 RepID=A6UUM7_META3|nr:TIGR00303 family protein [Methanococcus aeolicus]ABR56199.1 Nicotinate-nucleotide-dimethylbenzimidazole phosphoribosyltransferase [Methanococcus aeolicus Nankai-3]
MPIISINDTVGFLDKIKDNINNNKKIQFSCVLSSIETTKYVPISGVHKDVIEYTPAADMELVMMGKSLSMPNPPIDATGCPTPATITRANVVLNNIPVLTIDAGSAIKPKIPHMSVDSTPTGDIYKGKAMPNSKELFKIGELLGKNIISDTLIIGECVPGGTTTALGVLMGLGYDAKNKISSGSVDNPIGLKLKVVETGLKKAKSNNVFEVLNAVGDKMMPVVAGMVFSSINQNKPVILAGGTQMASVLSVIQKIDEKYKKENILNSGLVALGTTEFVLNDKNADLKSLVEQINQNVPLFASKFNYENSKLDGLKSYCSGSVKEGVGAGGISLYSYVSGLTPEDIKLYVEEHYSNWFNNI